MSAAAAWPLAAAAAASGGPGASRRPLSRRRESWLGGSCPPPEATVSPSGAGRLLFQACCRARSTGVRPPPLASFGVIALCALYDAKNQSCTVGLQHAPSCRFRAARPTSGAGGLQIAAYDTNLKVWHCEFTLTAVLSSSIRKKSAGNRASSGSRRTLFWRRSTPATHPRLRLRRGPHNPRAQLRSRVAIKRRCSCTRD